MWQIDNNNNDYYKYYNKKYKYLNNYRIKKINFANWKKNLKSWIFILTNLVRPYLIIE